MNNVMALILAAGKGTRMKSSLPKVLHKVGGKPMVQQVIETVDKIGVKQKAVIVGFGADKVKEYLKDTVEYVLQEEQNGTGHAVKVSKPVIGNEKRTILLLCGDTPLIKEETLKKLLEVHKESKSKATVLTAHMENPFGYGRIIRNEAGQVNRIVEQKDGNEEELASKEVNTGIYAFESDELWSALEQINSNNAQGELYITDVIGILVNENQVVSAYMTHDSDETLGINSRAQLAQGEQILKIRKNNELMDNGVTIIDPNNTYVEASVKVGCDTILYPGTILEGNTIIGENCEIGPNTRLTDVKVGNDNNISFTYAHECELGNGNIVGPYVHLRPKTKITNEVRIGNFVEVKNSNVGEGTKFPHLSYIGDSDIGSKVNIGCGTITVNYNGKEKHRTTIKDRAFVGCNSNLVAPVTIGEEGYVGAGSTITKDVPSRALAVGRSRQVVKENWVTEETFKRK